MTGGFPGFDRAQAVYDAAMPDWYDRPEPWEPPDYPPAVCKAGCELGVGHAGDCMDAEDIEEAKLAASNYERWAEL